MGIEKFLFITHWVKNVTSMHYISFISVQIISEISQKAKYLDNKMVFALKKPTEHRYKN